jgi:hypothetical protein
MIDFILILLGFRKLGRYWLPPGCFAFWGSPGCQAAPMICTACGGISGGLDEGDSPDTCISGYGNDEIPRMLILKGQGVYEDFSCEDYCVEPARGARGDGLTLYCLGVSNSTYGDLWFSHPANPYALVIQRFHNPSCNGGEYFLAVKGGYNFYAGTSQTYRYISASELGGLPSLLGTVNYGPDRYYFGRVKYMRTKGLYDFNGNEIEWNVELCGELPEDYDKCEWVFLSHYSFEHPFAPPLFNEEYDSFCAYSRWDPEDDTPGRICVEYNADGCGCVPSDCIMEFPGYVNNDCSTHGFLDIQQSNSMVYTSTPTSVAELSCCTHGPYCPDSIFAMENEDDPILGTCCVTANFSGLALPTQSDCMFGQVENFPEHDNIAVSYRHARDGYWWSGPYGCLGPFPTVLHIVATVEDSTVNFDPPHGTEPYEGMWCKCTRFVITLSILRNLDRHIRRTPHTS